MTLTDREIKMLQSMVAESIKCPTIGRNDTVNLDPYYKLLDKLAEELKANDTKR